MANRFRDRTMRRLYDGMILAYRAQDKSLFYADGRRSMGNAYAGYFWRGYDAGTGSVVGGPRRWDRTSRQWPAYACWCAGRDIALGIANQTKANTTPATLAHDRRP